MHNIFNISGLPPGPILLHRDCCCPAVSAEGPGRPCCPGEVIHDLEQVVPRARTARMEECRLFDEETWRARGAVWPVVLCLNS